MEELKTKYLFLDTSIFVENNFFSSKKLLQLENLAFNDKVVILITKIIEEEILGQLEKAFLSARKGVKEIKQILNKECCVLRNIDSFSQYFNIPTLAEDNLKSLKSKYELFKKSTSVILIDYTKVDIKSIFQIYFSENPPFKAGKKKYEFPDAFNIAAVEKWCAKNKELVYFITSDKDFKDYDSKSIIVKSLDEYLELVHSEIEYEKTTINLSVESKLDYKREHIIDQINEFFKFNFEPIYDNLSIIDFENRKIKINKFTVINYENDISEVELKVDSNFKMEYEIPDKTIFLGDNINEWIYLDGISNEKEIELSYSLIIKLEMETNNTEIIEFDLNPIYQIIENKIKNAG